jgi:predicted outer membrane repeat protein
MRAFRVTLAWIAATALLTLTVLSAPVTRAAGTVTNCSTFGAVGTLGDLANAINGGGIVTFACSGTITVPEIVISANTTIDATGQSVTLSGNNANRLFCVPNTGTMLTLQNVTVTNGKPNANCGASNGSVGGGIINFGILNLINSTVVGNSAVEQGGGIYTADGTVNILGSTFANNTAATGGAILSTSSTVNIANSTFSGNDSTTAGGSIGAGGSTINVTSSTFAGNRAASAGIIYITDGSLNLRNSILSNNTGGDCRNVLGTLSGTLNFSDGSCPGTIAPVTNFNTALANNGGPTQTDALFLGSNAIDAVATGSCTYLSSGTNPLYSSGAPITTDQRSVARPLDGNNDGTPACDAGAFEFVPAPANSTPTMTPTPAVADLRVLVTKCVAEKGPANSLLVKLNAGQLRAFMNEVRAQTGKKINTMCASQLTAMATYLLNHGVGQ